MRSLSILLATAATLLLLPLASGAPQCPSDDAFEDNDSCGAPLAASAGSTTGLTALNGDDDFWEFTVPAGHLLSVDILFTHVAGAGDLDAQLWDGSCFFPMEASSSISDDEHLLWTNVAAFPQTVVVRVYGFGAAFVCNDYELVIGTTPDPCLAAIPDSFEPNEGCMTSAVLPGAGVYSGLNVLSGDFDYFTITVPADMILTVDVLFTHAADGNIDTALTNNLCTINEDSGLTTTDNEQVSYINDTGSQIDLVLRMFGSGATFNCNTYTLDVSMVPDPCSLLPDDAFAPNAQCAAAALVTPGSYPALSIYLAADDWFMVTVPDQADLTIDLTFLHVDADIDMFIYDACGGATVASAGSASDNESASVSNTTGAAVDYMIMVEVWDQSDGRCANYDMDVILAGAGSFIRMCVGDGSSVPCPCANESAIGAEEGCQSSLGFGAILTASGSGSVAADDLAFTVLQGRPSQPSMLVQGASLTGVPFKDGVLCTGNPTERVEIVFLDVNGEGTSVSSIVTEGNVAPGDLRYYQQWFRDPGGVSPCGTGSNFTSGLEVTFTP